MKRKLEVFKEEAVFDVTKHCSVHRSNGCFKHRFCFGTYSAYVCVACEKRFASTGAILDWLKANAIYSSDKRLIDFKQFKMKVEVRQWMR